MRRTWMGGAIRRNEAGEPTYFIRRQIDGKRFDVSTRCHTERAALKQLERFEADPANYSPGGGIEKREPLFLDLELATKFLTYSREVKKNSATWRYQQKRYLSWWAVQLKGKDLRKVNLKNDIDSVLEGQTAKAHRIAVIKFVYSWLRKVERSIALVEDPTHETLMVPQSKPGSRSMKHKAIPREDYLRAREHLVGQWRAAVDVQLGTAWHKTEVKRFAEGGSVEAHPNGDTEGVAGVLVCPEAKGGGELRTPHGTGSRQGLAGAREFLHRPLR